MDPRYRLLAMFWPFFLLACISTETRVGGVRFSGEGLSPSDSPATVVREAEGTRDNPIVLADSEGLRGEALLVDRTLAFGVPKTEVNVQILKNEGFTVGFSSETRTPLWVGYRLFANPPFESGPRPSRFLIDRRVENSVRHEDYSHTGYDRGHMAPNAPIARCYGPEAQRQTFLTSNIIPQLPGLNQRGWEALESLISTEWAQEFSEVWVFTGPLFEGPCMEFESDVAVPSACYMIVVDIDERSGEVNALGVIMEQRRIDQEPLENFTVSVDEIEARTGIDFFHELDDAVENEVEGESPDARWDISQSLRPQFPGNERPIQIRTCD